MDCMNDTFLVAGKLVCALGPTPVGQCNELLDSLFFAQRVADGKANRFCENEQWLTEHDKALVVAKWMLVEARHESFSLEDEPSVTIASLIEDALPGHLPDALGVRLKEGMACMARLPKDGAEYTLFYRSVLEKLPLKAPEGDAAEEPGAVYKVVLQIGVLQQETALFSVFLAFSTNTVLAEDLFGQPLFAKDLLGPVRVRFERREWRFAEYSTVRDRVEKFIADKKEGLILPIPC